MQSIKRGRENDDDESRLVVSDTNPAGPLVV